jgi:hypothetical protein
LRSSAPWTGGILSISDLGRDARLKSAMVTGYLLLMELSCIFYRLAPYLRNPASRLIRSPKLLMPKFFDQIGMAFTGFSG